MSDFIRNLVDDYDNALDGLYNAAFGYNDYYNFIRTPIGLLANSYRYVERHLSRNIGNPLHQYDGYGTPIGDWADPFFNMFHAVPWFYTDGYKNDSANYIEYVRNVYGASLSVENINENFDMRIVGEASSVGVIETNNIFNNSFANPNGLYSDTKLGIENAYYAKQTLDNSISSNTERSKKREAEVEDYSITKDLGDYFGLNTNAIEIHNVLDIGNYYKKTSYSNGNYYTPSGKSPVEESNYGNYYDLGVYFDSYNSLGNSTQLRLEENLYNPEKKYYPSNGIKDIKTYFSYNNIEVGNEKDINNLQIRYIFETLEKHSNIANTIDGVYVYAESFNNKIPDDITSISFNSGARFGTYTSYGNGLKVDDLLSKTNNAFRKGKYNTIVARFYDDKSAEKGKTDTLQTAVSKFGVSHGRNLLKTTKDSSQGYDNPYCRVWTYHHQYHRLADTIRPFQEKGKDGNIVITQSDLYDKYGFSEFSANNDEKGFENGRVRLGKYGVINQHNGLVNITPVDNGNPDKKVDIRNCMFSIENLAWKNSWSTSDNEKDTFQNNGLSPEQKGPFGGRIMWFPPYDLKFNEAVTVDWNSNAFIGRGENIYTYKNTTRSGQLNFKILIDHPSVVNYWEGKGKSVSNSVNDIDDPEQQLLRFFAGCDMLSVKDADSKKVDTAIEDEPIPYPNTDKYTFFVFFPNDYSGVDNNDDDFAVEYLTNGVGTWKAKTWNVGTKKFYTKEEAETECAKQGISVDSIVEKYDDDYHPNYSVATANDKSVGGYEMKPGVSISIASKQTFDNTITDVTYGSQSKRTICAQIGSSGEHEWDKKWYYRVDKSNIDDLLKNKTNYLDSGSNCLNSVAGRKIVIDNFFITNQSKLFSFSEAFVALTENKNGSNRVLEGLYDAESKDRLKDIFSKKDKIKDIICTGQASIQGNSASKSENDARNEKLAKNRAETIAKWLKRELGVDVKKETIPSAGDNVQDNVNDLINKVHRSVRVDIYVTSEETKTVQEAEKDAVRTSSTGDELSVKHPIGVDYPNNNLGLGTPTFIDNSANVYFDADAAGKKFDKIISASPFSVKKNVFTFNPITGKNDANNINGVYGSNNNFIGITMSDDLSLDYAGKDKVLAQLASEGGKETDESLHSMNDGTDDELNEKVKIKRYDNESKFFELLEIEDPFMHKKISDKIKYFDPAYHSVSPEGFNARLTFLHQCTRQGPTCGASDINNGNNTANNLAFGRPPVCILRLGDFYYTRIIIDNITIDYGDVMWDLNAEGIGVMPMIADVSISFKYIGGSSLSGPITRLQNAVSFNAYANTEVYDNRAELAQYDENGEITKFAPFNPK